ncbi:Maf family protein, partial [Candidatus Microgenomates bacterium]|nr:Maf family protein [Candidatus Microgenomates bacterium]
MKIILASQSPARKRLLTSLGLKFEVLPASADESVIIDPKPSVRAKKIAKLKAETVYNEYFKNTSEDFLIIAADSFVYNHGEFIGKPLDNQEAVSILSRLSDNHHYLYSGVYLISQKNGMRRDISFYDRSKVLFRKLNKKEIEDFVKEVDVLKLAGSYHIEP